MDDEEYDKVMAEGTDEDEGEEDVEDASSSSDDDDTSDDEVETKPAKKKATKKKKKIVESSDDDDSDDSDSDSSSSDDSDTSSSSDEEEEEKVMAKAKGKAAPSKKAGNSTAKKVSKSTAKKTAAPDPPEEKKKKAEPKMSLAESAAAAGSPKKGKKTPAKDDDAAKEADKVSDGKKAAADEDDAKTSLEELEAAKRDVHDTCAWYVVRVGSGKDSKEIRAVAVRREGLCFGDDENATTILDYDDEYLKSTVMLVSPGDVAYAVGMENGVVRARGLAKNAITANAKRMVDIGFRRSGTMAIPPAYVFNWIRSVPDSIPEKTIARVEAAINNPECYEESNKRQMQDVGAPKVPRIGTKSINARRAKKSKSSNGASKKRKASASASAANGDVDDDDDHARPLKRGRHVYASDITMCLHAVGQGLSAFGQVLVNAAEEYSAHNA